MVITVLVLIHVLTAILSISLIVVRFLAVLFEWRQRFIQKIVFISTGSLIGSGLLLTFAGRGSAGRVCIWGASLAIIIAAIETLAIRRQSVRVK